MSHSRNQRMRYSVSSTATGQQSLASKYWFNHFINLHLTLPPSSHHPFTLPIVLSPSIPPPIIPSPSISPSPIILSPSLLLLSSSHPPHLLSPSLPPPIIPSPSLLPPTQPWQCGYCSCVPVSELHPHSRSGAAAKRVILDHYERRHEQWYTHTHTHTYTH